jgi:hypothetical protein
MSELEDRLPSDSSTDENSTAVGPTDNPRVDNDDSPVTNEHLMPSSSNGCKEVEGTVPSLMFSTDEI